MSCLAPFPRSRLSLLGCRDRRETNSKSKLNASFGASSAAAVAFQGAQLRSGEAEGYCYRSGTGQYRARPFRHVVNSAALYNPGTNRTTTANLVYSSHSYSVCRSYSTRWIAAHEVSLRLSPTRACIASPRADLHTRTRSMHVKCVCILRPCGYGALL